jgi:hypothetical protein
MRQTAGPCLVFAVGSIVSVACFATKPPATYDDAMRAASMNVTTPEGKAFDRKVGVWFGEKHQKTMVRCTEGVADSDLAPFDLLIEVGADGHVLEVVARPTTKVATCLRQAVESDVLPIPPKDDYWVRIAMSLKP